MRKFLNSLPIGVASALVIAAVLYLTLYPEPLPDNDVQLFPGADKVIHALMMLGVSGCVAYDCLRSRRYRDKIKPPKGLLVCLLAFTILFGGVIELLQSAMGLGRSEDFMDFVADSIGALVAFIVELNCWSSLRKWLIERR